MVTRHKIDEKKMGYRGSKSDFFMESVKEQRVDGSWWISNIKFPKLMHLRCTLMGFERNYRIKILSKQLNKLFFSTLRNYDNKLLKLNPWFITGFTDAEGCFSIGVTPDARSKLKWRVSPLFIINLHKKDIAILEAIKNTLIVGKIRTNGINKAQYIVETFTDLQLIVDHFDKYPLITAKVSDYLIFKECLKIINLREHLTEKGLLKIVGLKSSLNWGLSKKLVLAFPNAVPVNRPEYKFKGITEPFWVAGFTSGDGSFHFRIIDSKIRGLRVTLRYSINLHIREKEVIKGIATFFKLDVPRINLSETSNISKTDHLVKYKNIYISKNKVSVIIVKISDIVNIIIPFFEKYPIVGMKSLDFADFFEKSSRNNKKKKTFNF